jgi:hypothetical protein
VVCIKLQLWVQEKVGSYEGTDPTGGGNYGDAVSHSSWKQQRMPSQVRLNVRREKKKQLYAHSFSQCHAPYFGEESI